MTNDKKTPTIFNIELRKESDLMEPKRGGGAKTKKYPFHQLSIGYGFQVNDKKAAKNTYATMYVFMKKNPDKKFRMFRTPDGYWFFKRVR